jgi:predicted nuclease of predicted toxin-antitoxin system
MRFLANENFPASAVKAIAEGEHDIAWVRTSAPGITDVEVLAWAVQESRILLTFDKDFGELAWRAKLPAASGIVLFRLPMPPPEEVGAKLSSRIAERDDWAGHFTVIEPQRIRMRKLPE